MVNAKDRRSGKEGDGLTSGAESCGSPWGYVQSPSLGEPSENELWCRVVFSCL